MPHGYPDWGRDDSAELLYGLPDMAELAARLFSPNTHDRHGHVIFIDDLESGIEKWIGWGWGDGNAQEWSSEAARSGDFSIKLTCGDDGLLQSAMSRYMPYPVLSRFGFEFSIHIDLVITEILLEAWVNLPGDWYQYTVRYDATIDTWQVQDENGVWQNLAPIIALGTLNTHFHTIKLVVDAVNFRYVRLIVDHLTYDLSIYGVLTGAAVVAPNLNVGIVVTGTAAVHADAYVDDVIFTQHEP